MISASLTSLNENDSSKLLKVTASQASQKSKANSVRSRKDSSASESQKLKAKKQLLRKNKKLNKYFEMEADMGSDDEEHDDMVKNIDRNCEDEDEEGLDDDLDGFVVH